MCIDKSIPKIHQLTNKIHKTTDHEKEDKTAKQDDIIIVQQKVAILPPYNTQYYFSMASRISSCEWDATSVKTAHR